jgi:hypothetical protein
VVVVLVALQLKMQRRLDRVPIRLAALLWSAVR